MGMEVLRSTQGAIASLSFPISYGRYTVLARSSSWGCYGITEAQGAWVLLSNPLRGTKGGRNTVGGESAGATIVARRCAIVAWRGAA